MKKLSTLAVTAVLTCGLAVPALAADGSGTGTLNGMNDRTPATDMNGPAMRQTNGYGYTNGYGNNGTSGTLNNNQNGMNRYGNAARNQTGMDGFRMNNTTRANAATDNDGMNWGWLGLIGLLGLAGMRGRERSRD